VFGRWTGAKEWLGGTTFSSHSTRVKITSMSPCGQWGSSVSLMVDREGVVSDRMLTVQNITNQLQSQTLSESHT